MPGSGLFSHMQNNNNSNLIIIRYLLIWASLVVQAVKNPPAMQDTWVQSLGLEDPLEEARQSTPAFLAGEFPQTEEPGGLQCMGPQRVRHS